MDQEIEAFRARVAGLSRRWRGTPYPPDVRNWAVRLAEELRAAGLGPYAVGRRLGIRAETLSSWSDAAAPTTFARVVIEATPEQTAPPTPTTPPAPPAGIVVTSPGGWRIEGLGLADLAELARVLP